MIFCDSFDYACIILFLIDRLSAFYILNYTFADSDEVASLVKISNLIIIYSYFFLIFFNFYLFEEYSECYLLYFGTG